ncbi:hypothetical protein cypCar_00010152 [Cyprinus carpio]|nr:hypothetical protein cypCar_00010152 [Cyprinus carpio]
MERSERRKIQLTTSQPYDESFEVNAEEAASVHTPSPRQIVSRRTGRQNQSAMATYAGDKLEEDTKVSSLSHICAYDPADYEHLPVSTEIKELFQYITRYTPQMIELDHKLKPFIPDFIPAVGDIDAFLKVPRPDGKADNLGLLVLDEPCTKQSDPTVLSLWLSDNSKQHNVAEVKVKSIENPEKNPKAIDNWIESISELHRPMPDIDSLMQEWPPEFEELLGKVNLPTADIDCDLAEYVDIMCGILDIPVYKNRIHSLHVLFTLYSEFKNSQHFKSVAEGQTSDTPPASRTVTAELERLTLD